MRKQFNLQDWLKDKSQKIETRDGRPSRILCWDRRGERSLVVLVQQPLGYDDVLYYYESGLADGFGLESDEDLFLITPEPEMSEMEAPLFSWLSHDTGGRTPTKQEVKARATKLLALAREQLLQSGELLTQEHHEKLMETQYNETLEGVKKNWRDYFTPQAVTDIYNAGRNDVLKDLPRWKKAVQSFGNYTVAPTETGEYCLLINGYFIMLSDLEKLPKEDKSHD